MNSNQRYEKLKKHEFSLRWAKSETMIKYIIDEYISKNQHKIFADNSV